MSVLFARLSDSSFHGEIVIKNHSCVPSCVPAVSGGEPTLYMSASPYECVCAPEFTRAGGQNVHFSQHRIYSLLFDDKDSNHQRGYARRSLQTRGRVRVCTVSLVVTLAGMLPLHL